MLSKVLRNGSVDLDHVSTKQIFGPLNIFSHLLFYILIVIMFWRGIGKVSFRQSQGGKVDTYNDEDLPDDVLAADEVPPAFSCLCPLPPLTNYKLMIV